MTEDRHPVLQRSGTVPEKLMPNAKCQSWTQPQSVLEHEIEQFVEPIEEEKKEAIDILEVACD